MYIHIYTLNTLCIYVYVMHTHMSMCAHRHHLDADLLEGSEIMLDYFSLCSARRSFMEVPTRGERSVALQLFGSCWGQRSGQASQGPRKRKVLWYSTSRGPSTRIMRAQSVRKSSNQVCKGLLVRGHGASGHVCGYDILNMTCSPILQPPLNEEVGS